MFGEVREPVIVIGKMAFLKLRGLLQGFGKNLPLFVEVEQILHVLILGVINEVLLTQASGKKFRPTPHYLPHSIIKSVR